MDNSQMNSLVDLLCGDKEVSHDISKMLVSLGLEDVPSSNDVSSGNAATTPLGELPTDPYSFNGLHQLKRYDTPPSTLLHILNTQLPVSLDHNPSPLSNPLQNRPNQFPTSDSSPFFNTECLSNLLRLDASSLSLHPNMLSEIPRKSSDGPLSLVDHSILHAHPASTSSVPLRSPASTAMHECSSVEDGSGCNIARLNLLSSSEFLTCSGATGESDFLMRKLGGFRNIGWTLDHRVNESGQTEHQALVYSLHTFSSYSSPWVADEQTALKAALTKCYELEKGESDYSVTNATPVTNEVFSAEVLSPPTPTTTIVSDSTNESPEAYQKTPPSTHMQHEQEKEQVAESSTRKVSLPSSPSDPSSDYANTEAEKAFTDKEQSTSRVLVWASFIPDSISSENVISIWRALLAPTTRLLGVLKTPIPSQGLLVFDDLSSAIDFIRTAKSKQLEFFDLLVAGERPSGLSTSHHDVLFHPHTGDAIGFSLVNVSSQHPACVHTLLRLSQKDAVALGHKRTSTETLRLLLTHPEVSPVMVVPPAQPYGSFTLGRTTPLSQTPSHRRASIWCALCCTQSSDIPGAWKHLSRNPHEALRDARNASLLEWVAAEHPVLSTTLMIEKRQELSLETMKARMKESQKHSKGSKPADRRAEASVLEQLNLLKPKKFPRPPVDPITSHQAAWNNEKPNKVSTYQGLASSPKGLNPEASPFIPGGANTSELSTISSTGNNGCHRQTSYGTNVNAAEDDLHEDASNLFGLAPSVSMNETTILREWSMKQGLSPRQGKKSTLKPPSILEPSLRSEDGSKERLQSPGASRYRPLPLDAATLLMLEETLVEKDTAVMTRTDHLLQHPCRGNPLCSIGSSIGSIQPLLDGWTSDGSMLPLSELDTDGTDCQELHLLSSRSSSRRISAESLFDIDEQKQVGAKFDRSTTPTR